MDFSLDLYNGLHGYSGVTSDSILETQSNMSKSPMSSRASTPTIAAPKTIQKDGKEKMVFNPQTGIFQSLDDVVQKPNTSKSSASKSAKSGTSFSSMPSSINRPRGSVFKRALFAAGIPTKESRLIAAAEIGDVEAVTGFLSSGADPNWQNVVGETAMIYAAWGGHESVVAALLHHPATHANLQDNEGWTALMWASKAGHEGVVRLFLVHPDTEPDLTNNLGETALMKAAVHGHAAVVKLLTASYRTTIDKRHPDGSTALLWASAGGSVNCVNILLNAGADIDACDTDGMNSLMWAVSVGHVEVVELLLQKGCDVSKVDKVGRTPLLMACEVGHAEVSSFLLGHDDVDVNLTTKDHISALMRAAARGHSPLVNMLVKCKDIDINLQDSQGRTALFYAARAGQSHCVSIILHHPQTNCNSKDSEGNTPVMMAAAHGHNEALDALLKHPKIDLLIRTRHGLTALSLAAKAGHKTAVKAILAHPQSDINETDGQHMTALAWAAKQGSVLVVELLQQYQNLKPNQANAEGTTPLMWAARCNQILVVQTLLRDPRVDPIVTDHVGKTALDMATENNYEEVVHFLRRYQSINSAIPSKMSEDQISIKTSSSSDSDPITTPSAMAFRFEKRFDEPNIDSVSDVDRYLDNGPLVNWRPKSGKTSFAWAVGCGQTEVVKVFLLVPNLDVNQTDEEGLTPLMLASLNGHVDVVKLLLGHEKTDVNRGDRYGRTALMMAAINGHMRTLCTLLCCNHLNVNQCDNVGFTAISLAAQAGSFEITCELLKHPHTKPGIKTAEGGTALIYAVRSGHEDVAELLLERTDIDVNAMNNRGETALILAAGYQGSVRITTALLKQLAINVNLRDPSGHSALLLSARNNYLECCRLLLDQSNTDVNLQDLEGMTALMYAALFGHDDMVRIMFSHPATNPNIRCKENGSTALILAARNKKVTIVEKLASKNNVNVNMKDDFGATALNHCVRRNCKESMCHLLERKDIDVNIADAEGKTPLLRACSHGYYEIAMILLARIDVDVNMQTLEGKTALMYTAQMPEGLATLKLLLALRQTEVNAKDERDATALLYACKNGNTGAVAAILEHCSMDVGNAKQRHLLKETKDYQGYTPLMWGAILGFTEIVRLLLQVRGIEVNTLGPDGLTALGLACEAGHIDVVQSLASHPGVDINAGQDLEEGRTALVAALEKCQHECVCVLLQHPGHSLLRSKVRPPYLPPTLKNMVDLYRQNHQVRHALVLSCPPPSLSLEGMAGKRGGGIGGLSVEGGASVASALLLLPRPFQVVQHVLKQATPQMLAKYIQDFTKKIDPSEPGAVVLYISGEMLLTPEGPALCLCPATPHKAPTNVLLSSLVSSLLTAPRLILLMDVLSVTVTSSLQSAIDVVNNPHSYVLPPLVHTNMAAVVGVNSEKKQLFGSHRASSFSRTLAREILHGVNIQQLHQRASTALCGKPEMASPHNKQEQVLEEQPKYLELEDTRVLEGVSSPESSAGNSRKASSSSSDEEIESRSLNRRGSYVQDIRKEFEKDNENATKLNLSNSPLSSGYVPVYSTDGNASCDYFSKNVNIIDGKTDAWNNEMKIIPNIDPSQSNNIDGNNVTESSIKMAVPSKVMLSKIEEIREPSSIDSNVTNAEPKSSLTKRNSNLPLSVNSTVLFASNMSTDWRF